MDKKTVVKAAQEWIALNYPKDIPEVYLCVAAQAFYSCGYLREPLNQENATEADVCEWGHTAESCPDSDDCFNRCPVHNLPR